LDAELERVKRLADAIGSRVIHAVPRDPEVAGAELERVPVIEASPGCAAAVALRELHDKLAGAADCTVPTPLAREEFDAMFSAS
jgi:nitrogenase iron protein NifH